MPLATPQHVLFHRDYLRFHGGHMKMWDYFRHVEEAPGFAPAVYFTPRSQWDANNPWTGRRTAVLPNWEPEKADVLFLGGMDWAALDPALAREWPRPVLNFIQHVRHADPKSPLIHFLENKAIRLCVSVEVADALRATGKVNGPVFAIPNGIELKTLPGGLPDDARDIDLLIAGLKNPDMARALEPLFHNGLRRVRVLTDLMPRTDFLQLLARSRTTVFLPNPAEGFYLPALEAMALGTLVVCPDCIGNRSFCLDGINSLRPVYTLDSVAEAVRVALALPDDVAARMRAEAAATAQKHDIAHERAAFHEVLNNLQDLWKGAAS